MAAKDLEIIETGNGGDIVLNGNNASMIGGFQTMVYLALFGGNPGHPTTGPKEEGVQAFDWWGNDYLFGSQPKLQFNSFTEYALTRNTLNSAGRIQIQQAVEKDLQFMTDFAEVEVQVVIETVDRCKIDIKITEPDNLSSNEFTFIWDSAKNELTAA